MTAGRPYLKGISLPQLESDRPIANGGEDGDGRAVNDICGQQQGLDAAVGLYTLPRRIDAGPVYGLVLAKLTLTQIPKIPTSSA
jgi:hypothetical protein